MYEILTGRLDESYTMLGTERRVHALRVALFMVVPEAECNHVGGAVGTICIDCAPSWQMDYDFADPFPFDRVRRVSVLDLIEAGLLRVGDELVMASTGVKAVVTGDGGLMLPNGRVYANSSAAANAVLNDPGA